MFCLFTHIGCIFPQGPRNVMQSRMHWQDQAIDEPSYASSHGLSGEMCTHIGCTSYLNLAWVGLEPLAISGGSPSPSG